MRIADISAETDEFSGTLVVVSTERSTALVRDHSGTLAVSNPELTPGAVLDVSLEREGNQWRVVTATPSTAELRDLYPSSALSKTELRQQITEALNLSIADPDYRSLCDAAIASDAFEPFLDAPAAASHHHAYVGGLAEHTLSMLSIATSLVSHYDRAYPNLIDASLLAAGVFFHDFMKVRELAFDGRIKYTDVGNLIGHIPMAATWVMELEANASQESRTLLAHLILSHHGKKEYGAAVEPKTTEAILLHQIDMIDSRMNMCSNSIVGTDSGWTSYHRALGTKLFVHNND